jgi:hypothetical protein
LEELIGLDRKPTRLYLRNWAKYVTKTIRELTPGEELPEDIADQIYESRWARLQQDFQIIFLERRAGSDQDSLLLRVAGWLRTSAKESDKLLAHVPAPLEVSERLSKLSSSLYIESSPLFAWWDHRSSLEQAEAALQGVAHPEFDIAHLREGTHWALAPAKVKEWDLNVARKILRQHQALGREERPAISKVASRVLHEEGGISEAFKASVARHIKDLPRTIPPELRQTIDYLVTVLKTQTAPPRHQHRMDAQAPVTVQAEYSQVEEGKWALQATDQGISDRCWHLRVRPVEPLDPEFTSGRILNRLVVSMKGSGDILCDKLRDRGAWQIQIPIERVNGLHLLLDMSTELAQRAITEIREEALTLFFDWLLTS